MVFDYVQLWSYILKKFLGDARAPLHHPTWRPCFLREINFFIVHNFFNRNNMHFRKKQQLYIPSEKVALPWTLMVLLWQKRVRDEILLEVVISSQGVFGDFPPSGVSIRLGPRTFWRMFSSKKHVPYFTISGVVCKWRLPGCVSLFWSQSNTNRFYFQYKHTFLQALKQPNTT